MEEREKGLNQEQDQVVLSFTVADALHQVPEYARYNSAMKNIAKDLMKLDVYRGGTIQGNAGFVFEDLHAQQANIYNLRARNGSVVDVLGTNDTVKDLTITGRDGVTHQQAKMGYHGTNKYKIAEERYRDTTIVVDKGNTEVKDYLTREGFRVEESRVSEKSAKRYAEMARKENELTNRINQKLGKDMVSNAPVTAKLEALSAQCKAVNAAGMGAAKGAAVFAAGMSFGKNFYQLRKENERYESKKSGIDKCSGSIYACDLVRSEQRGI